VHHVIDSRLIFSFAPSAMLLQCGIGGQSVQPVHFDLAPLRAEWGSIDGDEHGHIALRGFDDLPDYVVAFVPAMQVEALWLMGRLLGKVVGDGTPDEWRRVRPRWGLCLSAAETARKQGSHPEEAADDVSCWWRMHAAEIFGWAPPKPKTVPPMPRDVAVPV
jgi:hypothetical protein